MRTCGCLVVVAVLVACCGIVRAEEPAAESKETAPGREELEKKFAETLTGATMTGQFTVTGAGAKDAPQKERYEIKRAKKLQGDYWLIEARIQYGKHDATLPLTLQVFWAGDTPVITLTKLPVPGFGTFTARVLVYDDQYAGTWSGAGHGGQLFGQITRTGAKDDEKDSASGDKAAATDEKN